MAYKIKFSKTGTKRQILDTRNDVYISKEQIKQLNDDVKDKRFSGVVVYLDKE